ncbi:MAG: HPF/RaiA family ribosome-associated protein [Burkholderiales bacterium]|nr:MAG: HPF/RaiA family ribosome-associated protein [Burkholderiales bacterium]
MQILFTSRDPDAREMRDITQRRLRFVLRRLAWLVPQATVRLTDVNGPRGGLDKQCQVELETVGRGRVVVASVAADWRVAIDTALARAARLLERIRTRRTASRRARPRLVESET